MLRKSALRSAAAVAITAATFASLPALAAPMQPEMTDMDLAARKVLNVTSHVQEKDQWCWATTGLSVVEYYGKSQGASQNQFCNIGRGFNINGSCPNEPAYPSNVQRGMRYFGLNAGRETGAVSYDTLVRNINSDAPVPVGVFWTAGGGHMINIVGVDTSNQSFFINNSWASSPRTEWVTYRGFTNNRNFRWGASIVGITRGSSTLTDVSADEVQIQTQPAAAEVTGKSLQGNVSLAETGMQMATTGVNALAQSMDKTAGDIQVTSAGVRMNMLNPAFVAGTSQVPAVEGDNFSLATTATGDKYVVAYDTNGEVARVAPGDDEVRYASMANGGTVFFQPQTASYFRFKDGQITALNESGRKFLGAPVVYLSHYQRMVSAKFGDKMEGSEYQKNHAFGGF